MIGVIVALFAIAIPVQMINLRIGEIARERIASKVRPAPLTPEWQRTIDKLKQFVETERGLQFKRGFGVVVESEQDFRKRLAEEAEHYGDADPADTYIALKALNLVDRKLNLNSLEDPLLDGTTLGYYDGFSDTLVVQAEEPTPFVRSVLVHELTHALQDQHFDLDREFDYYDESYLAFEALVEGDATRVEMRYIESLSAEERDRTHQEQAAGVTEHQPEDASLEVLSMLSAFPYEVGEGFVAELMAAGGLERVNQAFASPPATSEQVLHGDRFLSRDEPADVEAPRAEEEALEEGVWGERGLLTMLLRTIPREQAFEAAEGWGGDYYVAWKRGNRNCIRMNIVADSRQDRRELFRALQDWSATHPTASVSNAETIQVRACR